MLATNLFGNNNNNNIY